MSAVVAYWTDRVETDPRLLALGRRVLRVDQRAVTILCEGSAEPRREL